MKTKLLILFIFVYLALTFLLPYQKVLDLSWQSEFSLLEKSFGVFYFNITLFCLALMLVAKKYNKLENLLNKICSVEIIYSASISVLIITLFLTALNITGLWWAWLSFGLQVCTILLAYILLKDKMQKYEAIMVGVALASIAMAIWEIPYQWGLTVLTFPDNLIVEKIISEIQVQMQPLIGSFGLLFIINRKYSIIKFNKYFYTFLAITILLYIGLFLNGFHTDMFYDWGKQQYIYNNETLLDRLFHKGSKVTLALCLVSLIFKKEAIKWN